MKTKVKKVMVLEFNYESDEYKVMFKLLGLGRSYMIDKLNFTEEEFKTSCIMYEDFQDLIGEIGG